MKKSGLDLYLVAHKEIIEGAKDYIAFIPRHQNLPTEQMMRSIVDARYIIINEQIVMGELLNNYARGEKRNMAYDVNYFIALINDSLSGNESLMAEVNAKRRETLIAVRDQLEKRRDAEVLELARRTSRGRRIWRFRR